jgi:hypothetical protein
MYKSNDYGMKHIVIKNIDRAISSNWIKSVQELDELIDRLKVQLEDSKETLKLRINNLSNCQHEFKHPTYTVQQRVIGYVTVYEQMCKHCGYTETFQYSEESVGGLPIWTKNASQRYYNNSI